MKTRYCLAAVIIAAMFVPFVGTSAADEVTLKGEPVDIQCYLGGQSGEGHASCAKACAENGLPIGFVTKGDDGSEKMYLVTGPDRKPAKDYMAEHMGKQVEAKGTVTEKDGLSILTVSEVSAG